MAFISIYLVFLYMKEMIKFLKKTVIYWLWVKIKRNYYILNFISSQREMLRIPRAWEVIERFIKHFVLVMIWKALACCDQSPNGDEPPAARLDSRLGGKACKRQCIGSFCCCCCFTFLILTFHLTNKSAYHQ